MAGMATSDALANALVDALPGMHRPAVAAGNVTPTDAVAEHQPKRKLNELHDTGLGLVSDAELLQAQARHLQAVADVYPNVGSVTLGQLNAAKQELKQELRQELRQDIVAAKQELKQDIQSIAVLIRNQKLEIENSRRLAMPQQNAMPFLPLEKATAGHPNEGPTAAPLHALLRPVPIGARPPELPFFPRNGISRAAVYALNNVQLDDLAWFYNEQFQGPALAARRDSFLAFLTGGI
eukprot:CAMPEP_0181302018 /NCGR_PEP_ID=MMETSP1101-20121128/7740_1 /TAXON_ID=46948 /ORGANISM="Rhodomonas abbreviata, Strain Caron Lab Isolate" /LENGTH=236 /DNA_ID=CAMNT_0023407375 /DNA_START=507 /DNA_END=1217 /DNA_ORIENTATION=-